MPSPRNEPGFDGCDFAGLDRAEHLLELGAQEDRDDRRRRLVGSEAVVLPGARDRRAQQRLVLVDGLDDRRAEEQELQVLRRGVAGVEQVQAGVGAHRPVVVLARAVDAGERLLVQQADQPVAAGGVLHDLHRQHLVVGADVGVLEDRRDLELVGRDLVVACLDRDSELCQLLLDLEHVGEHPLGDRAEVVVVQLVALGGLGAEQRAPGRHQVGAFEEVLLVDQEVLLLAAGRREDPRGVLDAEQLERLDGGSGQRVHRAQQRDLVVERLTGPGGERGRDAQQRAVGVLEDERRRGRVPGGVAARLERRADASGRERGGVGLALDELLAGELRKRGALARRPVEGVVLLGRRARQRLEPVRVVGRALLHRPVLHRQRDRVRQRRVERLASSERPLQRLVDVFGQAVALDRGGEHVRSEDLVARDGQVGRAERGSVGAPLRGGDVLLAGPWWHERDRFLLEKGWGHRPPRRTGRGPRSGPASWAPVGRGRAERNRSAKPIKKHHRLAKSAAGSFDNGPNAQARADSGDARAAGDCSSGSRRYGGRRVAARARPGRCSGSPASAGAPGDVDREHSLHRPAGGADRASVAAEAGGDRVVDGVQAGLHRERPASGTSASPPGASGPSAQVFT